jgi:hypothetical protein
MEATHMQISTIGWRGDTAGRAQVSTCYECNGEGFVVICIDDICRGSGNCMHGDGEDLCPVCGGEGEIGPDYDGDEEESAARRTGTQQAGER